ncbi:hypothetical protein THRCLA_08069 [Thraustotheca clavata]|uniref:RanBP2-type domain-containing protein n=1 Tax=Thraustotheca clavata TaxID=74557 RepID=A0A1V9ZA43_9STRA|nr:hypothetical protein THRCLA_08069 [Thraustotheca clavata]
MAKEGLLDESDTSSDEEYRRVKRKRRRLVQEITSLTWNCPRCTYLNENDQSHCEMCSIKRPSQRVKVEKKIKKKIENIDKKYERKVVPKLQTTSKVPVVKKWACGACTLENCENIKKCDACGALREPEHCDAIEIDDDDDKNITSNQQLWNDKYHPSSMHDLCVHPKKSQEVVDWLQKHTQRYSFDQQRILFLCGPPGVGKSTMVHSAAAKLGLEIKQWKDTSGVVPLGSKSRNSSLFQDFTSFLECSQRYSSLNFGTTKNKNQIVLVEEWPSFHEQHRLDIQHLLQHRLASNDHQYPIVIVYSDVHENKVTTTSLGAVFSQEVVTSRLSHIIHCNPVAPGLMKKYLNRIALKEKICLTSSQLRSIIEQSHGDLRHAMNTLQLQVNSTHDNTRDSFPSDFHLIGRVLYPKDHHGDEILKECALESSHILATVHHNCIDCFTEIDDLYQALDNFSFNDTLLQSAFKDRSNSMYYQHTQQLSQSLTERSIKCSNLHPNRQSFRPISRATMYQVDTTAKHIKSHAQAAFHLQHNGAALHRDIVPYQKYLGQEAMVVDTKIETDDEIDDFSDMDSN